MDIKKNLEMINNRIETACRKAGRHPSEVTLLPVTKTIPCSVIKEAFPLGLNRVGENMVQEAKRKAEELQDFDIDWCVIGHLQKNKAKYVAKFAKELHSLDNLKLASELDKRLQIEGRSMDILIQVNSSGEIQKYGLPPEDVLNFSKELSVFSSLKIRGLMTLALFSSTEEKVRSCFKKIYELQELLRQKSSPKLNWDVLSMGMSGDFEIAIEEGATEIRIGQAIFGARHTTDSHYWP
ncbi:MAG: YggS family pyridoxal phosphate-dependent enzyme [Bdellovibrionales bacterium]